MIEKKFEAKTENLHYVLDFLESELSAHECEMKIMTSLCIAIEELFVNIASYSYEDKTGDAILKLDFVGNDVVIVLIDSGIEFNLLLKDDPDITLAAEEREIGGLGIYMVKKTMDDIKYERIDGQNILTMKKRIKNL